MVITYLANDTNLAKRVALKEYLPRDFATRTTGSTVVPNSDADAKDYRWGLERFLDEARTLARFDHPHLNKVYRFFEANGTAYLVLEYIDGQTLSHLLSKYPTIPDTHLQRIIHSAGYVHRDIKPSNLMLRGDGSTVLLDFGAARQAVGQRSKSITSILTPGYAPVEQYDTKAADVGPWSDLYALGMVAYRCVSGVRDADLSDAVTRARTQRRGGQDLIPAVEVGRGAYDSHFLEAIDWAIRVNEEERPQTIAKWREALPDGQGEGASRPLPPDDTLVRPSTVGSGGTGLRGLMSKVALAVVGVAVLGTVLWRIVPISETGDKPASVDRPGQPEERTETVVVAPTSVVQPDPTKPVERPTTDNIMADWNRAQKINTPAAYRQFITRHPSSSLTGLAETKLAETEEGSRPAGAQPDLTGDAAADWNQVQKINTPEGYRQFLRRHPSGPFTKLAEAKLAELE